MFNFLTKVIIELMFVQDMNLGGKICSWHKHHRLPQTGGRLPSCHGRGCGRLLGGRITGSCVSISVLQGTRKKVQTGD